MDSVAEILLAVIFIGLAGFVLALSVFFVTVSVLLLKGNYRLATTMLKRAPITIDRSGLFRPPDVALYMIKCDDFEGAQTLLVREVDYERKNDIGPNPLRLTMHLLLAAHEGKWKQAKAYRDALAAMASVDGPIAKEDTQALREIESAIAKRDINAVENHRIYKDLEAQHLETVRRMGLFVAAVLAILIAVNLYYS